MVVCPHCAFPVLADPRIISEREVICERCEWKGPSSKLLIVDDDKIVDPRVFDKLYFLMHKEIAPAVGRVLLQLGIVQQGSSPEHLKHLAEVLRDFSSAGFEAIVRKVLNPNVH